MSQPIQHRYAFSDLANRRLSPSGLCKSIVEQMGRMPGGVALYLDDDAFALTFAETLDDDQIEMLAAIVGAHTGDGPDTIVDKEARLELERAAAEAEAEAAAGE
jgi:hypothetical protein